MSTIYDFEAERIDGSMVSLNTFNNQVLLVVNTASKCGFTPQYAGLEELYQSYKDQGFSVLGFPCNQFAGQEAGSNADIAEFCQLNYGVSFPMFAKVDVNGDNAAPLWKHLRQEGRGLFGSKQIKWNFTKFLVNKQGKVIKRYAPTTAPSDISNDISKLLRK